MTPTRKPPAISSVLIAGIAMFLIGSVTAIGCAVALVVWLFTHVRIG